MVGFLGLSCRHHGWEDRKARVILSPGLVLGLSQRRKHLCKQAEPEERSASSDFTEVRDHKSPESPLQQSLMTSFKSGLGHPKR